MSKILLTTAILVVLYNLLFFHIGFGLGTGLIFLILNFYFFYLRPKQNPRNLHLAVSNSFLSVAFAFLIAFRDNGIVLVINFLASFFFLCAATYFYQEKSFFHFSVPRFLLTPLALLGSLLETLFVDKPKIEGESAQTNATYAALIKGFAFAIPVFLVLLFLLTRADPVFQKLTGDALQNLGERLIFSVMIFAGLFVLALTKVNEKFLREESTQVYSREKAIELIVLVSTIALLFAAFILVQFQYLFSTIGERELARVGIASLTYSEYVRKGFTELLVVSVISISVLIYCLKYLHKIVENFKMVLQILTSIMAVETGLIILSAGQRDILYALAHGLTRARIFGFIFLFFLAMILIVFLINIAFKIKRQHFFAAVISIATFSILLTSLINIDGLIARNFPPTVNKEIDYPYLTQISDDAYPSWTRAVKTSENLVNSLNSKAQISEDQYRQLYDARKSLDQINSKISFLEDKYGDYINVQEKYRQKNQEVPSWVKDVRNIQSFNLSQFLAYQFVIQNKPSFDQISPIYSRIDYYQKVHNNIIIPAQSLNPATQLTNPGESSGETNFR